MRYTLGECKWGRVDSLPTLRAELDRRVQAFPNARQATIGRRFFTRQRLRVTADTVRHERWHCLEDLYEQE